MLIDGMVRISLVTLFQVITTLRRTRMISLKSLFGVGLALTTAVAGVALADTPSATPASTSAAPAAAPAATDTAVKGPSFAGFIDGTYSYDMMAPMNGLTSLRSFDNVANSFRLNAAHLEITGSAGSLNYMFKPVFGTDPSIMHSSPLGAGDSVDLEEAYAVVEDPVLKAIGIKGATIKLGKFVTHEGIEVIESGNNPTITRGLLFGLAEPFTHTGGEVSIPSGAWTFTVGVANGMDLILDNNSAKMGLFAINWNIGDKVGFVNVSGCLGADLPNDTWRKKDSYDVTGDWKFITNLDLNWQVNYGQMVQVGGYDALGNFWGSGLDRWGGAAIEPLYKLNDAWTLGLRGEYFEYNSQPTSLNAASGEWLGHVATASNVTVTLAWNFTKNMTFRYEVRHDEGNDGWGLNAGPFMDSVGNMRRSTNTLGMEFISTF